VFHQSPLLWTIVANPFTGGKFSVRHAGETFDFDWAGDSAQTIQWAAFYSDCEHEVHEVTEGHRITLTYNLFLTTRTDLQAGTPLSFSAVHLPFAKLMKTVIADPRFLFEGGKIGIYLSHAYPHTHGFFMDLLPACLKGVDMVIYNCARALGLKCTLGNTSLESRYEGPTRVKSSTFPFELEP